MPGPFFCIVFCLWSAVSVGIWYEVMHLGAKVEGFYYQIACTLDEGWRVMLYDSRRLNVL